jgi:hypothetical protein
VSRCVCEDPAELDDAILDPLPTVLEGFAGVGIDAAQPGAAYAARHAVVVARRRRIDQLAARRGHGRSMAAPAIRWNRRTERSRVGKRLNLPVCVHRCVCIRVLVFLLVFPSLRATYGRTTMLADRNGGALSTSAAVIPPSRQSRNAALTLAGNGVCDLE